MRILRRPFAVLSLLALLVGGAPLLAQQPAPTPPEQQDEFIPIDQLPPQDQLPAAPLLIGAYAFVLAALFLYLFSVARRLSTVQREVERLEGDLKRSGRG
jgi:CcmD family protein